MPTCSIADPTRYLLELASVPRQPEGTNSFEECDPFISHTLATWCCNRLYLASVMIVVSQEQWNWIEVMWPRMKFGWDAYWSLVSRLQIPNKRHTLHEENSPTTPNSISYLLLVAWLWISNRRQLFSQVLKSSTCLSNTLVKLLSIVGVW
jgi:hypothetical protein